MPPSHDGSWERLGRLLVQRRIEIDPRYRNRRAFAEERGMNWRLLHDIERARRANFEPETLAAVEVAYGLAAGSLGRALAGSELEPAEPSLLAPRHGQLSGDPDFTPEIAELMAPYLPGIEIAIEVARRRYPGQPLTGAKIFPLKPDDADSWDRLAASGRPPEVIARRLAAVQAWEAELAQGKGNADAAGLIRA